MRAVVLSSHGDPDVLELQDVPDPVPGPDEVIVSRTVKDLVAGSGIEFADVGTHTLKGVDDTWQLYAVATG